MSHGRGPRLLVCVAAVVALVGLHAYGERSFGGLRLSAPQDVIGVHADAVTSAAAFRTEKLTRNAVDRTATWFGSPFAVGACAIGLLAVGHRRRGVLLPGAVPLRAVALPSSSPRAPPLRLS